MFFLATEFQLRGNCTTGNSLFAFQIGPFLGKARPFPPRYYDCKYACFLQEKIMSFITL